jgi:hypothetical protein
MKFNGSTKKRIWKCNKADEKQHDIRMQTVETQILLGDAIYTLGDHQRNMEIRK